MDAMSDAGTWNVAADFVLLVDVSGSMSGQKLAAAKDALLKISDMFNPGDRVSLVAFSDSAQQLSPLSPLAVAGHLGHVGSDLRLQVVAVVHE